jgi:hypothetical protein
MLSKFYSIKHITAIRDSAWAEVIEENREAPFEPKLLNTGIAAGSKLQLVLFFTDGFGMKDTFTVTL